MNIPIKKFNEEHYSNDLVKMLFILPPNITFDDFVNPSKNVSTITKNHGQKQFGSLITDIPLGIISLSAYLKKFFNLHSKAIDFNVELNIEEDLTIN